IGAGALGAAGALARAGGAWAQDASPAAGAGKVIKSLTRDEFNAELVKALGFTEGKQGGTLIDSNTADIQTVMPFLAEEAVSLGVVSLVFDNLIGGDPRTG